jgi:hypothetical protein
MRAEAPKVPAVRSTAGKAQEGAEAALMPAGKSSECYPSMSLAIEIRTCGFLAFSTRNQIRPMTM